MRTSHDRLAGEGHQVTYLTLRQWDRGERAQLDPRVRVLSVGPRMALYTDSGRRRILPPLAFGAGVLWHLLRHGRRYDVVHTASFPYFSLLAAGMTRRLGRFALVVDWHEVWSRAYWREYLGPWAAGGPRACSCCARACPARLLLLAPARRAPAPRGPARGGDGARPASTPAPCNRPSPGRPSRSCCSPGG